MNKMIKAKLKNWRWWLILPLILLLLFLVAIPVAISFLLGVIADLFDLFSDAFDISSMRTPRWLKRVCMWSDENDKI